VPTCGPGKSPTELEVPLIEHAFGEEFARAASTPEAPGRHHVDHFLDGSPLVGGHTGVQIGELAAKAGLTPLRHAAASPSRGGAPAFSRLAGPSVESADRSPARPDRLETQGVRSRACDPEAPTLAAHGRPRPALLRAPTSPDTRTLPTVRGTTFQIRAGPSPATLPPETSQATTTLGPSWSRGGESDHLDG
jgi:hypothetical protein